ncbi:MAG: N-acetylgalactosamine-4-sulfatase, partial [Planctomycetota bacterium]
NAASWPERTLLVHSQRIPYPEKWRKCAVMTERWRLVGGQKLYDIQADPGQVHDVAADHPGVVRQLRGEYEEWWKSLSVVFDDLVHISIGSDAEPLAQLHPHDCHVANQGLSSWHQGHVRNGHAGNGFWAIDVTREGTYEISLRRWPKQLDLPITAATVGGKAISATTARLKIGQVDATKPIPAGATAVTFRVKLGAGKTRMKTWLIDEAGKSRGAYFVYVQRLDGQ